MIFFVSEAEPKYLIAVQPIPVNNIKKHCKGTTHHFLSASEHFLLASINTSCSLMSSGKVNLQEPLHLVIGSVTPTTVLLSWGNTLKTSYEGNVMKECLEEGSASWGVHWPSHFRSPFSNFGLVSSVRHRFYTVRYRERNRKWNYRTCPTTDTVIDHLKPNTPYEFSVQSNTGQRSGAWSKSLIHSTDTDGEITEIYKYIWPLHSLVLPTINCFSHSFVVVVVFIMTLVLSSQIKNHTRHLDS